MIPRMNEAPRYRSPLRRAFAGLVVRRSILVAIVVGTILNIINQGDAILAGQKIDLVKMLLTFAVPFCVSTYGAYQAFRQIQ